MVQQQNRKTKDMTINLSCIVTSTFVWHFHLSFLLSASGHETFWVEFVSGIKVSTV